MLHSFKKLIFDWKNLSNYRTRKIINETQTYVTVEYTINSSTVLKGRSILFITDTHFRGSNFPFSNLAESINSLSPDWIIFGGDIVHFMIYINNAIEFLSSLRAKISKLAILGNWDIQKLQWNQDTFWEKMYKLSGFELLSNSIKEFPEISFAGIVPYTRPYPMPYLEFKNCFLSELNKLIKANNVEKKFTCLLSHSPVTFIQNFSTENRTLPNLVLCGHTHGGQIRVPFLGALATSSIYWKLFEYGHYHNGRKASDLIISNGIGCTGPKFRLFCKPEIARIRFI